MRRKMKKYLVILTAGIWAIGIKPNMVMAQDFTETMKHETEDELTADYVETGICVLENHENFGIVDLSYMDNQYTIKCDYSEYEIPMWTLCRLEIHPLSGYQVEFVKVNQTPVISENGVYEILMNKDFTEISVGYVEAAETKNSLMNEPLKDDRIPDSGKDSVSAISREVTVTYLNDKTEDTAKEDVVSEADNVSEETVVLQENVTEEVEKTAAQAEEEAEGVDEALSEKIFANKESTGASDESEKSSLEKKEPAEEKQNNETEKTKKKVDSKSESKAEKTGAKEEKTVSEQTLQNSAEEEENNEKISTKEATQIAKKSVINISKLLLYLLIICCILLVDTEKWIKKVRYNG